MPVASLKVATLRGLPILGRLIDFRRDRLGLHLECMRAGDIVRFPMLHKHVWCVSSPELVAELLVEKEHAFKKTKGLSVYGRTLLGDGLLTAEGDDHRRKRKLLAPAFAAKRIANYGAVMTELTERHAARWYDGQVIDVAEEMMRLTLAIVGKTLFDADIEGDARVVGEALTHAMEYMVDSLTLPLPMDWPLPRNKRMRTAVADLDEIVYRIIAERRASPGDRGDVLSILLEARDDDGSALTDRDVRDAIMTLMLAGHETTANALAWTWYLLAQHPAAYDKLLADPAGPWTTQVIEEAMRLYPPAYAMGRVASERVTIGPVTLEPGEIVMVTIRGIHRRPDLWGERAEAFLPERMTEDLKKARPRYAYMPFGAGPRVCIGNHFALMEAQLIASTIARRWRFSLTGPADVVEEPLVTLRPKNGVMVQVRPAAPS